MDTLVQKLSKANDAYRNGQALQMTDDEYDAGLEQLAKLNPDHLFLKQLRAAPNVVTAGKIVRMPFYLGSLDKAKVADELEKWTKKAPRTSTFVVAEKLDGISGLWNPAKKNLYLSGDDNMGVDVSPWLQHISLSSKTISKEIPEDVWIRGELIMPRSQIPQGKLGRSIVNGQFHLKTPSPEAAKVRFVGYEIIGMAPELSVQQQLSWLEHWGLWTPWSILLNDLSDTSKLSSFLMIRRTDSEYDMDGLVIRINKPMSRVLKGNPKDAIAWKPPNGETKLTKVILVEWNASATGKLVPRVQIEPVQLGGSTINFVTGVNARRVVDWKIGPGAQVVIRKGGDVIPLIESVEVPAVVSYPPEGTWEWDGAPETAVNIKQISADSTTLVSQFMKMVKHLDWPNVGPAVMKSVVEAGYTTVPLLRKVPEDSLKKLLGPVKGANLFALVQRDGWSKASELDLFIASPLRPDGIGKTRLEVLLTVEPNVQKWTSALAAPKGWSPEALKEFQLLWAKYEIFRKTEWSFLPYPVVSNLPTVETAKIKVTQKGTIVFSGFRDEMLEASLEAKGYKVSDTVKADTKAVIIADKENPDTYTSTKTEKAKKIPGCLILRRTEIGKL
uniref:DNA ligase (NAD(+)) n=1 Tax=viral metagenome TaxID=1070528 RepID=A0A6C0AND7_9ZZZZ